MSNGQLLRTIGAEGALQRVMCGAETVMCIFMYEIWQLAQKPFDEQTLKKLLYFCTC